MNFMKVFDNFGKKYEILDTEMRTVDGSSVYRIRALKDIELHNVKKGDLGVFIARESNLSHDNNCWVSSSACIIGLSEVSDNALVTDCAIVNGQCKISGNALVKDSAKIRGMATITDNARIGGCSIICDNATIQDNASIVNSYVGDIATIDGNIELKSIEILNGSAELKGNIKIGKYERYIMGFGG